MDADQVIALALPALNAASTADLVWWASQDLYNFADEALKRLARTAAVFAADSSILAGAGEIANPAGTLVIVHAAANGATLRPATVRELEALDANWTAATGTPKRWVQDLGLGQMRLYPAPPAPVTLQRIHHAEPAKITTGATTLTAPVALDAYVLWSMIGSARAQEGESQMADVADHSRNRMELFEAVAVAYYATS